MKQLSSTTFTTDIIIVISILRQSHTTMVPDSTSASTATAELDDLMTSLNNFKMDERNVDEPVIGGAPNLDDMLGNLQVSLFAGGLKPSRRSV